MKIFDSKRGSFLPLNGVGWKFRDVIMGQHDDIILCKPTGYKCIEWHEGLEKYDHVELYEHDYVIVDLKCGKAEKNIEGVIEWRESTAQFLLKRLDTNRIVWLNGLYNIRKVGNILEKDEERQDRIDSEKMRSANLEND